MRKTFYRALLPLLMALVSGVVMAADLPYVGKLTFRDDLGKELTHPKLLKTVTLQIGDQLDSDTLLNDVNNLIKTFPHYQNISTLIEPSSNNAVDVIFEFQMRRKIESVRIILDDQSELPLGIQDKLSTYRGDVFTARNMELDKLTIRDEFIRQGYPKVKVDHKLKPARRSKSVAIEYHVATGSKRVLVNDIEIIGNHSFRSSVLKKVMKTRARALFIFSRPDFKLFSLDEDMEVLKDYYVNEGFLNAKVSYDYRLLNDRYAEITIKIIEGERYKINKMHIFGNQSYAADKIRQVFGLKTDDSYSDKRVRQGLQKVREFYGERGHALVETIINYNTEKSELFLFIKENKKQYIEELVVKGNVKMKENVILRDVKMEEDDLVDTKEIERTLQRMRGTGYYSDVRIDYIPTSEDYGKLVIQVIESGTRYIRFGAGMGGNGFFGELSAGDNNLFGTGKGLQLHLQKHEELTKLGLIYRDPHLLGSDFEMTASVSYEDENREEYEAERIKALILVEKAVTDNLKVGLGTRVEFLNIEKVQEEIANSVHDAEGKGRIMGMVSTIFYTTEHKDAAGDAASGYKVRVAMLPSYSNNGAYIKTFTRFMGHKTLYTNENGVGHVLSGGITLGYVSKKAPFHEQIYAGGIGTIRGFEERSVRPNGSAGGANVLVAANASYSFPIWKNRLKGVIFVEAAAVGSGFSDLGDNIRAVGGLGVKANLRDTFLATNIEAGFAIPLRKQDGDVLKPFYFIFGDYDPAYDL